jgi:hypothetical protein
MIVRAIEILVKPERTAEFIAATLANHRGSLREPGVLRFDVLQSAGTPRVSFYTKCTATSRPQGTEDGSLRGWQAVERCRRPAAGPTGPGPHRTPGTAGALPSTPALL